MKYYYTLPSILIGAYIVLVQPQVAAALSAQEVENIGKEITLQIVDSENPTVGGSGVIIKRSGNSLVLYSQI
jgi:hypothetical protein